MVNVPIFFYTKCIGAGANGAVYQQSKKKVVKLMYNIDSLREWRRVAKNLQLLKNINSPAISKCYAFGNLNQFWYSSEKLFILSRREANMVIDANVFEYIGINSAEIKSPRLKNLIKELQKVYKKYKLYHTDLHDENIMKTKNGQFKVVDLDSFEKC